MKLTYWIIIAAIWIIGIPVAYFAFMKKWENPTWEKIYFSIIWPLLIPLYIIHFIHNRLT